MYNKKYSKSSNYQSRYKKTRGYSERVCLCCDRPFLSQGIENRLCTPCKEGEIFRTSQTAFVTGFKLTPAYDSADGR